MKNINRTILASSLIAVNLLFSITAKAAGDDLSTLKVRLEEMEKRINEIEAQNSLQNINWSGFLVNRYEHFTNNYITDTDVLDGYSTTMALNADISINQKTKFYTTIAMSKFWNLEGRSESWANWKKSEEGSYQLNGSQPYVDRAFMSYKFDIPLTFSIGRMPTNNGLPINQLDGLSRQGTYPHFAYNAIFDGLAFTYNFTFLPEKQHLNTSAFYTPWVNVDPYDRTKQWKDTNNNNFKTGTTPQYTLLVDYDIDGDYAFKKLNVEYMFYRYENFYWWGDNPNSPKDSTNNKTVTGGPNRYDGVANMLYIGADDIARTGFSASVSGQFYGSHYVDSAVKNTWAASYLFTGSQTFNSGKSILGAEFINTDKYFYLDESASLELIPFYSTPNSKGQHFYFTQRLTNNLGLRVGYYRLITAAFADNAVAQSDNMSYYANLRLDF